MNANKKTESEAKPVLSSFSTIQKRFSQGVGISAVSEKFNTKKEPVVEVEEEDPLEAYMQGIEKNAARQEPVADLAMKQPNTNEPEFEPLTDLPEVIDEDESMSEQPEKEEAAIDNIITLEDILKGGDEA